MKKYKLLTIIGSLCMLIGVQACASMKTQSATTAATTEIDKAKAMNNEWRDSRKLLKQAKKALKEGNTEKANKLIAKAKQQGIDAQIQAKAQMDVTGPH